MKDYKWFFVYFFWQALLLLLVYVFVADVNIRQNIKKNRALPSPITEKSVTSYPVLKKDRNPDITALAAVVVDDDSKTLLFSKNPTLLLSMASTTKIMTALVALSYYKMTEVLTIHNDIVEGAKVGFDKGQKVKFEVHLYNTHFGDTAGLLDDKGYTTPLDLARLTSIALKNKVFAQVVDTKSKDISDVDGKNSYSLHNLNKLLGTDGVKGVKTGYTDEAGQVLVTSKDEKGHTIIAVVMASSDRFLDTRELLGLISGNVNYLSIHP